MEIKPRTSWRMFSRPGPRQARPNPAAHRVRFFTALLLILFLGSTAQPPRAQAAQAAVTPRYYMDVANPKTKICVGETVEYLAKVFYVFQAQPRVDFEVPAVKIGATSANTSIGTFREDSVIAGMNNADLATASFFFTAKKTGTSNLFFEGFANSKFTDTYTSFTVPVTVINCKYKVTSRSQWMQRTPNGTVFLNTFMVNVRMTADEQGHFTPTGSTNATWVMTTFIPQYRSTNTIQFSQASLDGQLFENNLFDLNLSLNSTAGTESNCGAGGCGGGDVVLEAKPIKITFPARGGTRRVSHVLKSPGGQIPGWSIVTLKVEKP